MIHTIPSGSYSITDVESIRIASESLKAIELSVDFAMDSLSDQLFDELIAIRDAFEVSLTVHAPFRDINIASLNDAVYEGAMEDTLKSLDVAIRLGAHLLNVHPGVHGYFPSRYFSEMKRRERQVFQALCSKAEPHGIHVTVENLINTNVHFEDTWDLTGVIRLVEEVDHPLFGFCLDTGHAFQAGLDPAEAALQLLAVKAGAGRDGNALIHLHVHDNHGGPIDEHLPVGSGRIDWSALTRNLSDKNYSGIVVFENYGLDRQLEAWAKWSAFVTE